MLKTYLVSNYYVFGSVFMWVRFCILWLSCALFINADAAPKQQVALLTYHLKAPYIIDWGEQCGLYFDLAVYLNQKTDPQLYQFLQQVIRLMPQDQEWQLLLAKYQIQQAMVKP